MYHSSWIDMYQSSWIDSGGDQCLTRSGQHTGHRLAQHIHPGNRNDLNSLDGQGRDVNRIRQYAGNYYPERAVLSSSGFCIGPFRILAGGDCLSLKREPARYFLSPDDRVIGT